MMRQCLFLPVIINDHKMPYLSLCLQPDGKTMLASRLNPMVCCSFHFFEGKQTVEFFFLFFLFLGVGGVTWQLTARDSVQFPL